MAANSNYTRPTKLLTAIVITTIMWSVTAVFFISFTFAQDAGKACCCAQQGELK